MKALTLILTALTITSCGQGAGSAPTNDANQAGIKDDSKESTDVSDNVTDVTATLMVATLDERACTKANLSQLIYVKADQVFYVCDETAKWAQVDIKGKDGINGKDGVDGQDGTDGEDSPFEHNQWVDDFTGYQWFIGSPVTHGTAFGAAPNGCPTGYRLPVSAEGSQAVIDGLLLVMDELNAGDDFWINSAVTNPPNGTAAHKTYQDPSPPSLLHAAIVCLK